MIQVAFKTISCHDPCRKSAKQEKVEKDEDDIKSEQTKDDDGDGEEEQEDDPEEADIRDMRHKLETLSLF